MSIVVPFLGAPCSILVLLAASWCSLAKSRMSLRHCVSFAAKVLLAVADYCVTQSWQAARRHAALDHDTGITGFSQ